MADASLDKCGLEMRCFCVLVQKTRLVIYEPGLCMSDIYVIAYSFHFFLSAPFRVWVALSVFAFSRSR